MIAVVITIILTLFSLYRIIKEMIREQKRIKVLEQRLNQEDNNRVRIVYNREINKTIN